MIGKPIKPGKKHIMKNAILLFCFLFQAWNLSAQHRTIQGQWTACLGLDGAQVSDVEVLDSTLFICTSESGLYARALSGGEWFSCHSFPCQHVERCGNALITWGVFSGCYRSMDYGLTWQEMTTVWNSGPIKSLCVIDTSLFFTSQIFNRGVFRSDDCGNSIYSVNGNLPSLTEPVVTPGDNGLLFCFQNYPERRLFKSVNKGISWDSITLSGIPPESNLIGTIASQGTTMWISAEAGLFRMSPIGESWVPGPDSISFSLMKMVNGRLMGSTASQGPYRLNPLTNQWIQEITGLESLSTGGVCADDGLIYLATGIGPYSCDTSFNWNSMYLGLHMLRVNAISALANEVWVSTSVGCYVSMDYGTHFEKKPEMEIPNPELLILTDTIVFALAGGSCYLSPDRGAQWILQHTGLPAPPLVPFLHCNDLAMVGDHLFLSTNAGLYRSPASPVMWSPVTSFNTGNTSPVSVSVCDAVLFAVISYNSQAQYCSFRTNDQGQTWDSITTLPLPDRVPVFSGSDALFYALTYNHLSESSDLGMTWSEIPAGNPAMYGQFLVANGHAVIVGGSVLDITLTDLYLSITYNDGLTWTDIRDNLPKPSWPIFTCLETHQQRTFVSPLSNGLWFRDDLLTDLPEAHESTFGEMSITPNPAGHKVTVRVKHSSPQGCVISMYDMRGIRVFSSDPVELGEDNPFTLDSEAYGPGLYVVEVISGHDIYRGKLTIIR
jgi:hypothetical protein